MKRVPRRVDNRVCSLIPNIFLRQFRVLHDLISYKSYKDHIQISSLQTVFSAQTHYQSTRPKLYTPYSRITVYFSNQDVVHLSDQDMRPYLPGHKSVAMPALPWPALFFRQVSDAIYCSYLCGEEF